MCRPLEAEQAKKWSNKHVGNWRFVRKTHPRFKTRTHVKKAIHQPQVGVLGLRFGVTMTTIEGQSAEKQVA